MTKSDISYSSVPTASATSAVSATPYVEGFQVGSSHAVTVIVDEKDSSNTGNHQKFSGLDGSRRPVTLQLCPECHADHVRTMTKTYPSALTWCSVAIGAIIFFPLCWIPLVLDPLKQTDHYCQSCGKKIGQIKALEGCCVKEQY